MNKIRDPIAEWTGAITTRLIGFGAVIIMTCFVLCLVAPLWEPYIKWELKQAYVLNSNYEKLAETDMKRIRPILWSIAIVGWILVLGISLC